MRRLRECIYGFLIIQASVRAGTVVVVAVILLVDVIVIEVILTEIAKEAVIVEIMVEVQ